MYRRVKDGILGLAIGDAMGVPVEFMSREELRLDPVTGYRGGGTHGMPKGTWSDDTSMTICLLQHMMPMDHHAIMQSFHDWITKGDNSATGIVFDYGRTTKMAISKFDFEKNESPVSFGLTGEKDCGNGSLMRILPLAFYLHSYRGELDEEQYYSHIHDISSLTHAHPICKIACAIYVNIAINIINISTKEEAVKNGFFDAWDHYRKLDGYRDALRTFNHMYSVIEVGSQEKREEQDVKSDSYVVSTLDASLWCFLTADSFEECVLKAVNLGEDTDTTAAVAGGLAGMYYGFRSIPESLVSNLKRSQDLQDMSDSIEVKLNRDILEKDWSSVFSYIDYFKSRKKTKWGGGEKDDDGLITFRYPLYDPEVTEFISTLYSLDVMDTSYGETLENYGVPMDHENFAVHIDDADIKCLQAMLTAYIRQEHFCDGLIASAIENGNMAGILQRIRDIIEEEQISIYNRNSIPK